jgi:hypothetical protein
VRHLLTQFLARQPKERTLDVAISPSERVLKNIQYCVTGSKYELSRFAMIFLQALDNLFTANTVSRMCRDSLLLGAMSDLLSTIPAESRS